MVGMVEQYLVQASPIEYLPALCALGEVLLFFWRELVVFIGCHKCKQDAPSLFHQRVELGGANGNKRV
jgi:hypothetical protein